MKLTSATVAGLAPRARQYEVCDSDLPGLRIRVSPSGVKVFAVVYRTGAGLRRRFTIGRFSDALPADVARRRAKDLLGRVAAGQDPQGDRRAARAAAQAAALVTPAPVAERPTLHQFLTSRYLPWFESQFRAKNTRATLLAFPQGLLDQPLEDLAADALEQWRQQRHRAGIAAATTNRALGYLQAAVQRAVEWGLLATNPVRTLKRRREDSNMAPRFLQPDEEVRLRAALEAREAARRAARARGDAWRAARGYPGRRAAGGAGYVDHLAPLTLAALNTGLRLGELLNLRWRDVDFDRRYVTVHGATAKSGRTRHVPLNSEAVQVLRQWGGPRPASEGYVFPARDGGRLNNVKRAWSGLLTAAGIRGLRFHDLRHTTASRMVQAGVDLYRVQRILGHSSVAVTQRYAHLQPEHLHDAVEHVTGGRPT